MDMQNFNNITADLGKNEFLAKMNADPSLLANFQNEVRKAAEIKTTYTWSPEDRSVFSPENLEADIKLMVPTTTPLRNRFPRTQGLGEASAWKKLTSRLHSGTGAAGVGTATAITFADASAPNETSQTYSVTTAAYKLLGRKVEIGGLAYAASRGGSPEDMFEHRKRIKMYEVMLGEEELIIGGDATTRTNEFDGLGVQITTNSGTASLVTISGLGTYCQTLSLIDGYPTAIVLNARNARGLADELQGTGSIQRIVVDNQGRGIGGVHLASVINPIDGSLIDVLVDKYVGGNAFLLTERSPAGEVWIDMQDLIPMSRIDVPSSNFSSIAFVLEATVLRVIGEVYQYRLAGCATS